MSAPGAAVPFLRGTKAVIRVFMNTKELVINAKNWTISENAEEISDPVGGEDRDRLDIVTNSYELKFSLYQSDLTVLNALIADRDNDDAAVAPLVKQGGLRMKLSDGTRNAYMFTEMVRKPWTLNMGSRTEAVMVESGFRFRNFKSVQAA